VSQAVEHPRITVRSAEHHTELSTFKAMATPLRALTEERDIVESLSNGCEIGSDGDFRRLLHMFGGCTD
jgi:hypothetical protein